jgi:hypothetical protein
MGREQPLRISCDDCPGGPDCRDCLVAFFVGERDAQVVRLAADADTRPGAGFPLEPDLRRAVDALADAGLEPQVLAQRRSDRASRAS